MPMLLGRSSRKQVVYFLLLPLLRYGQGGSIPLLKLANTIVLSDVAFIGRPAPMCDVRLRRSTTENSRSPHEPLRHFGLLGVVRDRMSLCRVHLDLRRWLAMWHCRCQRPLATTAQPLGEVTRVARIWLRLALAKAAKFEPIAVQQKGAFAVQLLGLRPSLAPDVSRTVKEQSCFSCTAVPSSAICFSQGSKPDSRMACREPTAMALFFHFCGFASGAFSAFM